MHVKKSQLFVLAALIMVIAFIVTISPMAVVVASNLYQDAPPAGPGTGTPVPGGFCGDGICDYYSGELSGSPDDQCPQDCLPPTPTTTVTVNVTGTTTATIVPTSTSPPLASATPTPTVITVTPAVTNDSSPTPTNTISVLDASLPGGSELENCEAITFGQLSRAVQQRYLELAVAGYTPGSDNVVLICESEIESDTLCLPLSQSLLDAVENNANRIGLFYCDATNNCTNLPYRGQQSGDRLCFSIVDAEGFACNGGCTLIPLEGELSERPEQEAPFSRRVLLITVGAVVAVLLAAGAIFLLGGKDEDEEEEKEASSPGFAA